MLSSMTRRIRRPLASALCYPTSVAACAGADPNSPVHRWKGMSNQPGRESKEG